MEKKAQFSFVVIEPYNGSILAVVDGTWDFCCESIREYHFWQEFEISVYMLDENECPEMGGTYELIDYMSDELFYAFDNFLLAEICGLDHSKLSI